MGIQTINKTARHCQCSFKQRIVYFPPFDPKNSRHIYHDNKCILSCCCCTFYNDETHHIQPINIGDIVLWHGRKCVAESKVNDHSNQDYRIKIDGVEGKYVVALSSLQIIKQYINLQNDSVQKVENLHHLNSTFDSQKNIWDDLSFVLYTKKFW